MAQRKRATESVPRARIRQRAGFCLRMTSRRGRFALLIALAVSPASRDVRAAQAQTGSPPIQPAPTAVRVEGVQTVIKAQHVRLPFTKHIERVAVGDPEILSFELI